MSALTKWDRRLAEAHLTLKGYVPVRNPQRVGIRSTDPALQHLATAPTQAGLVWFTGLDHTWQECEWAALTDLTIHNMFGKWMARYEP